MKTHHPTLSLSPSSPRSPEMLRLDRKWELFVSGREVDLSDISPVIREAWIRSKQAGVDPAMSRAPYTEVPAGPELLREEIDWLSCAEPVFSFLRSVLAEPHQLIFLGDHQGHVLFTDGGQKAMARAEELCGIPGGEWGEEKVGCTILGTSLYTGTPVQVCWQENYCLNWKDWINHSAPIRAPMTQEILGALGIAGYRELSHPRALELVIKAAEMIETAIREQETKARLLVLEHFTRLTARYPSEGLLAIDKRGYILAANLIAEKILPLPHSRMVGRRVHDVPPLQEHLGQFIGLTPTQSLLVQEHWSGATIFPVSDGRIAGAVILLPQLPRSSVKEYIQQPWATVYTFSDLIGQSSRFRECLALAQKASQQDWPVLLLGESGTGKELFAQAIHSTSPRRHSPFVAFSCAAASDELIGTELFGYTEGTFTGALKGGKRGKIQLAHLGTLFLDDIDTMPPKMQASLLRVLEEGQIVPLGAHRPHRVDVRIIAAANKDPEQAVSEGKFRQDLYYRLNVFPILLPPLRERSEDIPLLAKHILSRNAPHTTITEGALHLLSLYSWPGNVRELRNVLVQAATHAQNGLITPAALPAILTRFTSATPEGSIPPLQPLKETEMRVIAQALEQTKSIPQAASLLGLHHSTLYRKLKKYKIDPPRGPKRNLS